MRISFSIRIPGVIKTAAFLLTVISFIVSSCKKDKVAPAPDLGYSYFPVSKGHWIIYEVDSTWYLDSLDGGNERYQLKEEILDIDTVDNMGEPAQVIDRYFRMYDAAVPYDQIPWVFKNRWTIKRTSSNAQRVEGNTRYLKLVFPPQAGKKWNGNAFNDQDRWNYEYTTVGEAAMGFSKTLTVSQSGLNDPLINTQLGKEIYAENVGMIYREFTQLEVQNQDTLGTEYTMTLVDYKH